jgi:hypothetical protein
LVVANAKPYRKLQHLILLELQTEDHSLGLMNIKDISEPLKESIYLILIICR